VGRTRKPISAIHTYYWLDKVWLSVATNVKLRWSIPINPNFITIITISKLQDQDHLFFQDQDRSGQDHFFKTKTAFLKTFKLLNQTTRAARNFDWEGPKLEKNL